MPGSAMTDMHWSASYVGMPWREDAEGPDAYDCKGLVRHVLPNHLGRPAPRVVGAGRPADWAALRDSVEHDGWRKVPDGASAKIGDIIVLQGLKGAHVGVVITGGRLPNVLHAEGGIDKVTGKPRGEVTVEELRDLLAGRYSRPALWRYGA